MLRATLRGARRPRDAYLTATVQEILRHRPVLPHAEPRLTKRPVEIGGFRYPPGVMLVAYAHLVHHDPAIYPEPQAFRPERFLEQAPGTYTWLPFGGGRRRCLGASFALLEMKLVIRAMLQRFELEPPQTRSEKTRRRNITVSPAKRLPADLEGAHKRRSASAGAAEHRVASPETKRLSGYYDERRRRDPDRPRRQRPGTPG